MSTNINSAKQFFEACETGKGWETCSAFCRPEATFPSQTTVLSEISTLEGYCEWMKNLFTPVPDGHYELKFFAADDARNSVAAFAVFHGTQTGPGGPVPEVAPEI
jgi:predicted ester cyclase